MAETGSIDDKFLLSMFTLNQSSSCLIGVPVHCTLPIYDCVYIIVLVTVHNFTLHYQSVIVHRVL